VENTRGRKGGLTYPQCDRYSTNKYSTPAQTSESEGTVSRVLWENGYSTCAASQLAELVPSAYIVQRRSHSSRTHTTTIPGRNSNNNRMDIRLSVNQTTQNPRSPMIARFWQDFQCNQTR
jgi:hypothetical protein